MSFYDELQAATAAERAAYLSIPLITETVRNGASRALYLDFLTQAYHHVKHTYPLLALASVHTTDEVYQDALVEYMKEERGHEKWILDDIGALGGDADEVRDGRPGEACEIMVGYTYYAIEWISPYAMLGSVHVLEGMSTALADRAAEFDPALSGAERRQGLFLSALARCARYRARRLLQGAGERASTVGARGRRRNVEADLPPLRQHLPRARAAPSRLVECGLRSASRSSPAPDPASGGSWR